MSAALVSRFLAFAAIGGRTLAEFGGEFANVMKVYGDDLARNMTNADELTAFIDAHAADIAKQAGDKGDDFVKALRSAAPALASEASTMSRGLESVMTGFQANAGKFDNFASYLKANEQAIRTKYGDVVFDTLDSSAPQIEARIASASAPAADAAAAAKPTVTPKTPPDPAAATSPGWNYYASTAARTGWRNQSYAALRTSADWLAQKGVIGTAASIPLRMTAGTIRWGLPVMGLGLTGIVGTHLLTGGESTRALARGANETADWVADSIKDDYPEAAKFLRDMGPEAGKVVLAAIAAPVDTAATFLGETAKYRGIELPPEQAQALAQFLHGSPLMAALTAGGYDISAQDMIQIYQDAQKTDDPNAYIEKQLKDRLHLTDEQMAAYKERATSLQAGAAASLDKIKEYEQIAALKGAGLTSKFNEVVSGQHLNMFSSMNMFLATVLGWVGDMLGFDGLGDTFKRAVVMESTVSQFGDKFNLTADNKPDPSAKVTAPAPSVS